MLKKLWIFFIIALSFTSIYMVNRKPIFSDYSQTTILYTQSNSSNCHFKEVSTLEYPLYISVYGEACQTDKEQFNLEDFLTKFNAKIVFVETVDNQEIYYARSNRVKYSRIVNGERVNLQIAIASDSVFLGSPIIYGSF